MEEVFRMKFNYDVLAEDLKHYCEAHNLSRYYFARAFHGRKNSHVICYKISRTGFKIDSGRYFAKFYPVHHDAILEGLSALDFNVIKSRGEADEVLSQYISDFGTRQFLLKNLYWKEKGKLALRMNLEVLTEQIAEVGEALPTQARFKKTPCF